MHLICSQENLVRGLGIVKSAVSSKLSLPILSHILIDARAGRLRLAATNLELSIHTWIAAQIEEPGAVAVPARLICDFVNTLPDAQVTLTLNPATQTLRVVSGRMVAHIKGLDANEFPDSSSAVTGEPKATLTLDPQLLRAMLERVMFAAAIEESRPVLTGVLAKFEPHQLTLAAADGFRLSVQQTGLGDVAHPEPFSLVIPVKPLQEVSRLCHGQREPVQVIVAAERNQVRFVLSTSEVITQLIDGAYPDVSRIIPQTHTSRAVVNVGELLNATKMVGAFVDNVKRGSANGVRLEADVANRRVIVMGAHAERGEGVGDIDAAIEGEAFQVSLQVPYLLALLERIAAPQLAIEFVQNGGQPMPVVMRPVGDADFVHVIMPLVDQ